MLDEERKPPVRYVLVNNIKISSRFREQLNGADLGKSMTELREGLREHGLINPITIDSDLNLVAGFRRLMCAKELGWIEIACHNLGDLSEIQRKEIELEENLLRKDFEWDEVIALRKNLHQVKQELYGSSPVNQFDTGWGLADTAASLGTSKPRLSADITLATVVEAVPSIKAEGDTRQEVERKIRKLVEQLERELSLRQSYRAMQQVESIQLGNCLEKLRDLPNACVDCVICDPPYGTDVDAADSALGVGQGRLYRNLSHFADSQAYAQELLVQMLPELKRIMKENAHAYFFFGITEYQWVFDALRDCFGGRVDAIPLIWAKDGNRWGTGNWNQHYTRSYEGIFFVSSPQRSLAQVSPSVLTEGSGEDVKYTAQKPLGLLQFLIEQSTQPGELVVDPTCGHGSTPIVCARTNRKFWACEQVESAYRETKAQVAHELKQQLGRERAKAEAEAALADSSSAAASAAGESSDGTADAEF